MLRLLRQGWLEGIRFESLLKIINCLIFELDWFEEAFVSVSNFIFFEILYELPFTIELPMQNQADIQPRRRFVINAAVISFWYITHIPLDVQYFPANQFKRFKQLIIANFISLSLRFAQFEDAFFLFLTFNFIWNRLQSFQLFQFQRLNFSFFGTSERTVAQLWHRTLACI